jgi:hypothetical protein
MEQQANESVSLATMPEHSGQDGSKPPADQQTVNSHATGLPMPPLDGNHFILPTHDGTFNHLDQLAGATNGMALGTNLMTVPDQHLLNFNGATSNGAAPQAVNGNGISAGECVLTAIPRLRECSQCWQMRLPCMTVRSVCGA